MDTLKAFLQTLFYMLSYSDTDYELVNRIVGITSSAAVIIMLAVLVLLVLLSPGLRTQKRFEDRLVFSECVLMIIALIFVIFTGIGTSYNTPLATFLWIFSPPVQELLYLLTILQWLIFVDYSLYRSPDRIRRRYKGAIIPFVIGVLFRFYDLPMMALGVMLTYIAVIRRDTYLDHDTGFYNLSFLDFLSTYRDRKKYEGGNGILIHTDMTYVSEYKPKEQYEHTYDGTGTLNGSEQSEACV